MRPKATSTHVGQTPESKWQPQVKGTTSSHITWQWPFGNPHHFAVERISTTSDVANLVDPAGGASRGYEFDGDTRYARIQAQTSGNVALGPWSKWCVLPS